MKTDDRTAVSVVGLNLLVTGAAGRARISGGGGPGALIISDRFTEALTGCTSTAPGSCQGFTRRHSNYAFSVQALVELDVSITANLSTFGRFTLAAPLEDPGSGHTSVAGGIRFSIR